VDYYANLQARVEYLINLLHRKPLELKQVYLEGQNLEIWRDELLRELKTMQQYRRSGRDTVLERMQETFGTHADIVRKLLDATRAKITENVSNCLDQRFEDPEVRV
jgi:hypothetical protein